MTKISLFSALAITATLIVSGCDSSSNGGGDEDGNHSSSLSSVSSSLTSSTGTSSSLSSVSSSSSSSQGSVAYTCSDTIDQNGIYMNIESGTEGDITYDCKVLSATNGYNLTVPAITITDVKKVDSFVGTYDGKTVNGAVAYDFKTGTVHFEGTYLGKNVNCTQTYLTALPADFYLGAEDDLEAFLEDWGTGEDYITSNCPSELEDYEPTTIDVVSTTQITVTDDQSSEHKIAIRTTIKY